MVLVIVLFTHLSNVVIHLESCVWPPEKDKFSVPSILALFLVSTNSWGVSFTLWSVFKQYFYKRKDLKDEKVVSNCC